MPSNGDLLWYLLSFDEKTSFTQISNTVQCFLKIEGCNYNAVNISTILYINDGSVPFLPVIVESSCGLNFTLDTTTCSAMDFGFKTTVSIFETAFPTPSPTWPTSMPSSQPSMQPSSQPSSAPSAFDHQLSLVEFSPP